MIRHQNRMPVTVKYLCVSGDAGVAWTVRKRSSTRRDWILVEVTLMARTEAPDSRGSTGRPDDRVVEHMIVHEDEGTASECVLLPSDCPDEALATEWIAADDGSYVPLDAMR